MNLYDINFTNENLTRKNKIYKIVTTNIFKQ